MVKNPSSIKNKAKRTEVYAKYKQQKKKLKKKLREERVKEIEELGEAAPPKQIPRTIENTREENETLVKQSDLDLVAEVEGDERDDEFAPYFANEKKPKIMISTRPKCSKKLFSFIGDLMQMVPNSFYYPRETKTVKEMVAFALGKSYTHLVILSEKDKACNGLLISHLPVGPTAFFKLSSFQPGSKIPGHGKPTSHIPELILNNFDTRVGRRIGRFLGSLYPHEPQFEGRQVMTFHNQRDFIFVRHHRYIYRKEKDKKTTRARLQELGPRFTLKLKWLQEGSFDTEFGEYEWVHNRQSMETSRRKFEL